MPSAHPMESLATQLAQGFIAGQLPHHPVLMWVSGHLNSSLCTLASEAPPQY